MLSVKRQVNEERDSLNSPPRKDLSVKVVSCDTAKRLGDAICAKYKKAFDLLKNK